MVRLRLASCSVGLPRSAGRSTRLRQDEGWTWSAEMRFLSTAARDVRSGYRILWRSPGSSLVIILTIALGIGLNVAIFSVVHAVLWRSLPYPDAGRMVAIAVDTRDIPSASALTGPMFDPRDASDTLMHVAQVEGRDASIEINGVMERVPAARATDDPCRCSVRWRSDAHSSTNKIFGALSSWAS